MAVGQSFGPDVCLLPVVCDETLKGGIVTETIEAWVDPKVCDPT